MIKIIIKKIQTMFLKNSDISGQVGRAKMLRMVTYAGVASMAIYALCFICPPVHDNDSHAITGTSVASDTTLSISLSGSELPLDITPTSSNGTFVSTADDDTKASTAVIHVATNNITGYTLGIKASNPASSSADKLISNNEKCENTPTSNKCAISSLSQPVSSEDYINNTIEGIDLNNTWGYAPSHYNSTPNTTTTTTLDPNTNENITTTSPINYYPAPVNGDTIATTDAPNQENTTTNDGTLQEDEYTIDYGMRIDYTPYTGTYSTNYNNQSYIITAVGNPVPYSVSYNANKPEQAQTDTTVDNMPTAQAGNAQGGDTVAVPLSQKVPTIGTVNPTTGDYEYAGYVFTGWCTMQPTENQTTGYQTCPNDARVFQPGDNFGIDQTTENTQILYAVWGAPAAVIFNSNGLVFNDAATATENIMTFIPTYVDGKVTSNKVNVIETGIYRTPILSTTENYIFKGWSTDQYATEATYANEQAIINDLTLNANDSITLYAVWTYTTIITFDGNGADSGTMEPLVIEAGKTEALPQNVFVKEGYVLSEWNTIATPTEQSPGETYANEADYQTGLASASVTLYAQWKIPPKLYDNVAAMSKGIQTLTQLDESITVPTTNDPLADESNSGVYEYDAIAFGEASDASNTNKIYYYRGVLEPEEDQGEHGSDGNATTYPNYVRLGNNTCWRIVRTTGSGGVKMIYNGTWTGYTCANSTTNAQLVSTSPFNDTFRNIGGKAYSGLEYHNMHAVGYTYTTGTMSYVQLGRLLGATGDDTTTNTEPSIIKQYTEDWYSANMSTANYSYTEKLEIVAGYCNDRSVYKNNSYDAGNVQPDNTYVDKYGKTGLTVYAFGAYARNVSSIQHSSFTCPRGVVDNYSTTTESSGNGQLTYPIALITADEASFAGSGRHTIYNTKSFLNSGSNFWTMSPRHRMAGGYVRLFYLNYNGFFEDYIDASSSIGVRPVISLKHEVTVAGGDGTATNPWTINE